VLSGRSKKFDDEVDDLWSRIASRGSTVKRPVLSERENEITMLCRIGKEFNARDTSN